MTELDKIVELILQAADKEEHPDKVSCIHSALMQVTMRIGEEMQRIRDEERNRSDRQNRTFTRR